MSFVKHDIYIEVKGDPSVGINSLEDCIQLNWDLDEFPDERERARSILKEAWMELYDDGGVKVRFGDECEFCGKINCKCVGR